MEDPSRSVQTRGRVRENPDTTLERLSKAGLVGRYPALYNTKPGQKVVSSRPSTITVSGDDRNTYFKWAIDQCRGHRGGMAKSSEECPLLADDSFKPYVASSITQEDMLREDQEAKAQLVEKRNQDVLVQSNLELYRIIKLLLMGGVLLGIGYFYYKTKN